jgi:hypothetical protein
MRSLRRFSRSRIGERARRDDTALAGPSGSAPGGRGQSGPGLTSRQHVKIVHKRLQFFPFNTRLSPILKLLGHPFVGGADARMIFG